MSLLIVLLPGCLANWGPGPGPPGFVPRHSTLVLEKPKLEPDYAYGETPWLSSPLPFDEALVSWNVDVEEGSGALFFVQTRNARGEVSPWLDIGEWGTVDRERALTTQYEAGRIDVDTLIIDASTDPDWHGLELRVRMRSVGPSSARLALLAVTFSDRHGNLNPAPGSDRRQMPAEPVARLEIPFRSQRSAAPALAPRICSPTSVDMVLAAAGIRVPVERVASLAYDPTHDLYGVWPRSIQSAYVLGLPGFLTRFEGWAPVHALLSAGVPLVISIKAAKGELRGAPYSETEGHLLLLAGVDQAGDLLVLDPAAPDIFAGVTIYSRSDLERCWLENGGTAYLFVPQDRDLSEIIALL